MPTTMPTANCTEVITAIICCTLCAIAGITGFAFVASKAPPDPENANTHINSLFTRSTPVLILGMVVGATIILGLSKLLEGGTVGALLSAVVGFTAGAYVKNGAPFNRRKDIPK